VNAIILKAAMVDRKDYFEAVKGIAQGISDVKRGRTQSARKAFAEIREKYRIPPRYKKNCNKALPQNDIKLHDTAD
jgi:hypothetical protein